MKKNRQILYLLTNIMVSITIIVHGIPGDDTLHISVDGLAKPLCKYVLTESMCSYFGFFDGSNGLYFIGWNSICLTELIALLIKCICPHYVNLEFDAVDEPVIECVLLGVTNTWIDTIKITDIYPLFPEINNEYKWHRMRADDSRCAIHKISKQMRWCKHDAVRLVINKHEFSETFNILEWGCTFLNIRILDLIEFDKRETVSRFNTAYRWNEIATFGNLVQQKYIDYSGKYIREMVDDIIIENRIRDCDTLLKLCMLEANKYGVGNMGWV